MTAVEAPSPMGRGTSEPMAGGPAAAAAPGAAAGGVPLSGCPASGRPASESPVSAVEPLPGPGHERHFSLPAETISVPTSRALVAGSLGGWGLGAAHPARQSAMLVLSELVTNSVRHAAVLSPRVDVMVSLTGGVLTIAVHDRHPFRPAHLPQPHSDGVGGWGLYLVETLAAEAGGTVTVPADEDGGGKTVTVRLPVEATAGV